MAFGRQTMVGGALGANREGSPRLLVVAATLGVLLAHWPVFSGLDGTGFNPSFGTTTQLWPGLASWTSPMPGWGTSPSFLVRLFGLALLGLGAWLTGQVALRFGVDGKRAALAAFLFALSPILGSALFEGSGRLYLPATLAWLGLLALEPQDPAARHGLFRAATQALLAALCLWLSQGAFLPCLALYLLLRLGRRRRSSASGRLWFAIFLTVLCVPLLFFRELVSPIGFGFTLQEGLGQFDASSVAAPSPGPPFLASLLACFGVGLDVPFFVTGRTDPDFDHLWSGLFVFLLVLLPTPAPMHRKLALRFGGLAVLLASFGVALVAGLGKPSAVPLAAALPAAVGVAVILASLAQPSRRRRQRSRGWAATAIAIPFLLFWSFRLETASSLTLLERAHALDHTQPYVAVQIAEHRRRVTGELAPEPIREMLLNAKPGRLSLELEKNLGLRLARNWEESGDVSAALQWVEEWLEKRPRGATTDDYLEVRARRVGLLLQAGQLDQALAWIEKDCAAPATDAEYDWRVAEALMDFVLAEKPGRVTTTALLARVEELLEQAVLQPDACSVAALVSLAQLRAHQARYVDAVRIAEKAAHRHPNSARPELLLARIYLAIGEVEEGLRRVAVARRIDPEDSAVRFLEGRLLSKNPQTAERGIEQMLAAYESDPELPQGLDELVEAVALAVQTRAAQGDILPAENLLRGVIARLPRHAMLLLELARLQQRQGKWNAAQSLLETALEEHPEDPGLRDSLGELLRNQGYQKLLDGDRTGAVETFERVIALAPENVALEGMQAVIRGYREPHARGPTRPGPEEAARREELVQKARAAFEEGVQFYRRGDLEAAAERLEESLRQLPENPLAQLYIGQVRLEQGHPLLAVPPLRAALKDGPELGLDVEHAHLLLLRALLELEQRVEAEKVADSYRTQHPEGAYREQIDALLGGDG